MKISLLWKYCIYYKNKIAQDNLSEYKVKYFWSNQFFRSYIDRKNIDKQRLINSNLTTNSRNSKS